MANDFDLDIRDHILHSYEQMKAIVRIRDPFDIAERTRVSGGKFVDDQHAADFNSYFRVDGYFRMGNGIHNVQHSSEKPWTAYGNGLQGNAKRFVDAYDTIGDFDNSVVTGLRDIQKKFNLSRYGPLAGWVAKFKQRQVEKYIGQRNTELSGAVNDFIGGYNSAFHYVEQILTVRNQIAFPATANTLVAACTELVSAKFDSSSFYGANSLRYVVGPANEGFEQIRTVDSDLGLYCVNLTDQKSD